MTGNKTQRLIDKEIRSIEKHLIASGWISGKKDAPMVYVGSIVDGGMLEEEALETFIDEEKDAYLDAKEVLKEATKKYKRQYTPLFKTRLHHDPKTGDVGFALVAFPLGNV